MIHETKTILVRAHVDVGIIPLVEALLRFPDVVTHYSCEGDPDDELIISTSRNSAYVIFTLGHGNDASATFRFATYLQEEFDRIGDTHLSHVSVDWFGGTCRITLNCHHNDIGRVVEILTELSKPILSNTSRESQYAENILLPVDCVQPTAPGSY